MLFLSGWTEAEIVRELGLRRGKVRWQIDRIKEKFATVRGEKQ
jgi:DNA-binding CsgD family transcriptional regulator